ncbi:MAG: alpha/beta hydrolase [Oscillospiraceae bacterium]|nr:alpha/beta hydrolase [Oscillospiraceae bacterium]
MSLVVNIYKKNFLQRYDEDGIFPFANSSDFPGLSCEQGSFRNSAGIEIRYFYYSYEAYDPSKLILLCPGLGPGHRGYFSEIDALCRAGYKVLTLDYTGCGASGGERLSSCNAPVKDARELLEHLQPEGEILPVGHSLGGYTALCLANLLPAVHRAVVISAFADISDLLVGFLKLRLLANRVKRFEQKLDPAYGSLDNHAYLASTQDKLLWIHSKDDPMVNYSLNAGQVLNLNNPNVRVVTVEGKKHMPQYTSEALKTMNAWMGEYNRLVREKKLQTKAEKQAFFADKPVTRMTEQDPAVIGEILRFLQGACEERNPAK